MNESILDDITADDTESATDHIVKNENNKKVRQKYYRNTIRIFTGAKILEIEKMIQDSDD